MKRREEILSLQKRPVETVTIQIPADTRTSLQQVAATKEMSEQALLKLYIGNGLRQDLARLFSDRVLEMTQKVLTKHLQSEEEVHRIMQEIRGQEAA
jgi:predicted house-cleaning NTP pyrophosphatase (Maf/HAM1 superfamily)